MVSYRRELCPGCRAVCDVAFGAVAVFVHRPWCKRLPPTCPGCGGAGVHTQALLFAPRGFSEQVCQACGGTGRGTGQTS